MEGPLVKDGQILAICRKAYEEHVPRPEDAEWEEMLPPEERRTVEDMIEAEKMPYWIKPASDTSFDRVCLAQDRGEIFTSPNGARWKVLNYNGRPWTLQDVDKPQITTRTMAEKLISKWATDANGPHPDPYVATVEVQYAKRGWRALYGVRRSGAFVLWAN